jgi:hypothetical protein
MPTPMIWPAITGPCLAGPFPAPSACPRPSPSTDNSVYVGYPPPEVHRKIIAANLASGSVTEEEASEWELGKNQCAAAVSAAARG